MLAALLQLRNPGSAVDVAFDGSSGLALAAAGQHDAVILDLTLPDIAGADVAVQIRRARDGACPILIALSGSVADVALQAGRGVFDHAFTKPVNVERLTAVLFPPG